MKSGVKAVAGAGGCQETEDLCKELTNGLLSLLWPPMHDVVWNGKLSSSSPLYYGFFLILRML